MTPNLRFMHRPTKRGRGWKRSAASCLLKHSTYLHHRSLLPLSFQRDHLRSKIRGTTKTYWVEIWRQRIHRLSSSRAVERGWVPGCISPLRPLRPADSINRPMQSDEQASLSLASKQLRNFLNEASVKFPGNLG
jgi:hypothetical protein